MAFLVYSRLDQNRCRPNTIKLLIEVPGFIRSFTVLQASGAGVKMSVA